MRLPLAYLFKFYLERDKRSKSNISFRSSCDTEYATATDKYTGFPGDTGLLTQIQISSGFLNLKHFLFRCFAFKVCSRGQPLSLHSDQVKSVSLRIKLSSSDVISLGLYFSMFSVRHDS